MDADFIPGRHSSESLTVAIIDQDPSYRADINRYYEQSEDLVSVIFQGETLIDLYEYLGNHTVDILLINVEATNADPAWYRNLLNYNTQKIILVAEQLHIVRETELIHENVDLIYKYTPMGTYTQKMLSFTPIGQDKDIFTSVNAAAKEHTDKKISLFYSPKGGVGTTTIAVNTAAQLTLKDKNVLLVDFALFGHVSVAFNLPQGTKGLSDVVTYLEQGRQDDEELDEVLRQSIETVSLQGKKLSVLSAGSPLKMAALSLDHTDRIMEALQRLDYDMIVVDSSTDLSERNISLMSNATDLFFVLTTDVAANWSMLSSVDIIRKLHRPLQNRYLIINAYHDSIGFPISEMESMLSMKVSAVIPHKYEQVQGYANRGIVMAEKPALKINKHYRSIANLIEPMFEKKEVAKRNGLRKGVLA
ncbi:AAA family ATPase [Geomicrobium sp. JCM 19055]|uniref:AAA family ATPase n=1 Tax=Geomicrobium sp. JCM 19055 TaxID=1460649 RepID=UPI00045ED594|nr:AAA family ATPase [Geomicrobium sp. JCM 19055]GAJ98813.1 type II/IV secretion system ATPase TadZ/CpaE, associated with Flp pilus assembly [Geomicrobium sp. JCM 19055]